MRICVIRTISTCINDESLDIDVEHVIRIAQLRLRLSRYRPRHNYTCGKNDVIFDFVVFTLAYKAYKTEHLLLVTQLLFSLPSM